MFGVLIYLMVAAGVGWATWDDFEKFRDVDTPDKWYFCIFAGIISPAVLAYGLIKFLYNEDFKNDDD